MLRRSSSKHGPHTYKPKPDGLEHVHIWLDAALWAHGMALDISGGSNSLSLFFFFFERRIKFFIINLLLFRTSIFLAALWASMHDFGLDA